MRHLCLYCVVKRVMHKTSAGRTHTITGYRMKRDDRMGESMGDK